ncbi:MAG: cell division protein SepF [Methanomassiliicoccaceae archaeon]|nr:cell division protein SepF [Methanomassiliicoccaceae archaeon]
MFGKKKKEEEPQNKKKFIDLSGYGTPMYSQSDAKIMVVEVTSNRDLKALTDLAYRGNILVLDFSRFTEGDQVKRDMAKRFLDVAADLNGAFTEVSERLMVLSPSGLGIEKLRISYKEK